MNNPNALITILGEQLQEDETSRDRVEFTTDGHFEAFSGGFKIKYQESELTGLAGITSEIEVGRDIVTLMRSGDFSSQMMFESAKRHECCYITPYGQMEMSISTSKMNNCLRKNGGKLELSYTISVCGKLVSSNDLKISVRLKNNEKERPYVQ